MKLVLDTNIYTDFAEGIVETVDFIADHGEKIYLPAVVLGELNFGFMKGRNQLFNEQKLRHVIRQLDIQIIVVDADVARQYGLLYLKLQKKGTPIPINDVWIGASCMSVGGTLLTRDKHFRMIDQMDAVILNDE